MSRGVRDWRAVRGRQTGEDIVTIVEFAVLLERDSPPVTP